jgi:putative endopeptidase
MRLQILASSLLLMATAQATLSADQPITTFPYTPSLDVTAMDTSANACEDFYQYACGGWKKNNPIPADQARWSVYGKLAQDNQKFLWGILDGLAKKAKDRDARQQKIGDYFGACMDQAAVDKLAAQPLQPFLQKITALKNKKILPALLADLHLQTGDSGFFFGFGSNQDFADSSKVIAFASAGGLSLPDRDYYLKTDEKSKTLLRQYSEHVARMFVLLGDSDASAKTNAAKIVEMETALATASLTRVDKRDPHKLFHALNAKQLQALTPRFAWDTYLKNSRLSGQRRFNVTEPEFFKALAQLWQTSDIADVQTYLRWHLLHTSAAFLSRPFVDENFAFFSKTLYGVEQQEPRWKQCVGLVDSQLGEALGQEFTNKVFSPELKASTQKMTQQIEEAMAADIKQLDWMSEATKQKALEKLHGVANKIGYPDHWRDYGAVNIKRDDFFGNVARATLFESRRNRGKIGQPLDRSEWGMTPPTVNAYYNPQMNDINFPAGVLQPPLYDAKLDDAPNYGNTGGTIGHELTHGFDDEGRQFDAQGNLKDWWTQADAKEFTQRAQCVVDQYAGYTIVDDIKINSKLTLGEDLADLGGLILGWMAWQTQIADNPPPARDGFTPEQRFFIGYAQWACENARPEALRVSAATNPHSPGQYRVNGLVVNMPEFAKAFSCKAGQAMVKEKPCRVW